MTYGDLLRQHFELQEKKCRIVGERRMNYTNALNALLGCGCKYRAQVGVAVNDIAGKRIHGARRKQAVPEAGTTVCWVDRLPIRLAGSGQYATQLPQRADDRCRR